MRVTLMAGALVMCAPLSSALAQKTAEETEASCPVAQLTPEQLTDVATVLNKPEDPALPAQLDVVRAAATTCAGRYGWTDEQRRMASALALSIIGYNWQRTLLDDDALSQRVAQGLDNMSDDDKHSLANAQAGPGLDDRLDKMLTIAGVPAVRKQTAAFLAMMLARMFEDLDAWGKLKASGGR